MKPWQIVLAALALWLYLGRKPPTGDPTLSAADRARAAGGLFSP